MKLRMLFTVRQVKDSKRILRSCISTNDRQYNGQIKTNDRQYNGQIKTNDRQYNGQIKKDKE
jgi:hypothetical protein